MTEKPTPGMPSDDHQLVIPIPRRQLSDFIMGLLSEPRRVSKDFSCVFQIDRTWIANAYDIIRQRVSQNDATEVAFKAVVRLSDGRSVHLESIDALGSFNDITKSITHSVNMSVTFMVAFPAQSYATKQVITISALADQSIGKDHGAKYISRFFRSLVTPAGLSDSRLRVSVETDNLTWGEDIINSLSNYINSSFPKSGFIKQQLAIALSSTSAFSLSLLAVVISLMVTTIGTMDRFDGGPALANLRDEYQGLIEDAGVAIEAKVDLLLAAEFADRPSALELFNLARMSAWGVAVFALFVMFRAIVTSYRVSFVILNDYTLRTYNRFRRVNVNKYIMSFFAFFVSIVASMIGSGLMTSFTT